jgi:hypothetical protein
MSLSASLCCPGCAECHSEVGSTGVVESLHLRFLVTDSVRPLKQPHQTLLLGPTKPRTTMEHMR